MNKKGISTVVATVLIVLITVAAVTILWAAISPMIDQNLQSSTACFDAQNALSVDSNSDYSCYDDTGNRIQYRVERNSYSGVIPNMTVYYDIDGTTSSYSISGTGTSLVPSSNGAVVNNITGATMITPAKVTLSVAPIIVIDGEQTACLATSPIEIRAC